MKVRRINFQTSNLRCLPSSASIPGRFGPEQLSVSVGADIRLGIAGWIIDSALGRDADIDEESAKLAIGKLCERKLAILTPAGRLEATAKGVKLL